MFLYFKLYILKYNILKYTINNIFFILSCRMYILKYKIYILEGISKFEKYILELLS